MNTIEPSTTLLRSLRIQARVIGALLMREVITRFGRKNLGVLWLVAEPMLFTLGITALWSAAGFNHGSSLPIVAFALTGYSSVLLWRNTVTRCNSAIQANINLLFHRNVRVIDVFLTRIVLEMAGCTGSFLVLFLFFYGIEWIGAPVDLMLVIQGWLMLAWFGAALAMLIGSATAYSDVIDRLWHPAAYLLFPLSGAAFMVAWLPPQAREVVLLLPMVHGVEMIRDGFFGNAVTTYYDVGYLAAVNLVLTLMSLFVLRDASMRVEAE